MDADRYDLNTTAAARFLNVHVKTLKRWVREGEVDAFRTPGGWYRFRISDLEKFLREHAA